MSKSALNFPTAILKVCDEDEITSANKIDVCET